MLADFEQRVATDRENVRKSEIAREVLVRLNEAGESMLRQRRELVKRIAETDSYAACWPEDAPKAKGVVAEVREIVNVKDSFTRMRIERDRELADHRRAKDEELALAAKARADRLEVGKELSALFGVSDAQARGRRLESVLNQLFALGDLSVRESFAVRGPSGEGVVEQIDGVIEMEGHLYLVEVKWLKQPVGVAEVSEHLVRLFGRGEMRGIFISASGYTDPAISTCRDALAQKVNVLCKLEEFVRLLERGTDIGEFLKQKVEAAALDKQPLFHSPLLD